MNRGCKYAHWSGEKDGEGFRVDRREGGFFRFMGVDLDMPVATGTHVEGDLVSCLGRGGDHGRGEGGNAGEEDAAAVGRLHLHRSRGSRRRAARSREGRAAELGGRHHRGEGIRAANTARREKDEQDGATHGTQKKTCCDGLGAWMRPLRDTGWSNFDHRGRRAVLFLFRSRFRRGRRSRDGNER